MSVIYNKLLEYRRRPIHLHANLDYRAGITNPYICGTLTSSCLPHWRHMS